MEEYKDLREECKDLHEFVSQDRQIHVNLRKECKNLV